MTDDKTRGAGALPIILIAAVIQGWSLYGLHVAIKGSHWPATAPGWLLGCYALAVFVPLTAQLLVEHIRQRTSWILIAALGVLFGYFGWHHGSAVVDQTTEYFVASGQWFPLGFVLSVLWLLMLPFMQARLTDGNWRPRYEALFANAWRNKLTLAEAALFTGLFWLLLILWSQLFEMLGIGFFEDLFQEPIFIYPVTSLTFGIALHLIGSVARLTSVVLEQLLNVLKWLAVIAGLILTLFTVALIFKLPGMMASGERAIGASWLLWLVAVTVLLVNAAYRDGSVERPYPRPIALALRCIVPLTIVIALTAVYAMYLRVETFGITVTRVWAMIVAIAACIYAIGYGFAARRSDRWMASIASINVATAVFLIVTLSLALTPVLSPWRIAANSQFKLAQQTPPPIRMNPRGQDESPLQYLRFGAGRYGIARLEELMVLQDHPLAEQIRMDAKAMRAQTNRWISPTPSNIQSQLANLRLPAGREIDPQLRAAIAEDLRNSGITVLVGTDAPAIGGAFIDLNRDQQEDFVLVFGVQIFAYTKSDAASWRRVGQLVSNVPMRDALTLQKMLQGEMQARDPQWQDLQVGDTVLRMNAF
jgi:hypothetical protein